MNALLSREHSDYSNLFVSWMELSCTDYWFWGAKEMGEEIKKKVVKRPSK